MRRVLSNVTASNGFQRFLDVCALVGVHAVEVFEIKTHINRKDRKLV
jgi:hypothetical protein